MSFILAINLNICVIFLWSSELSESLDRQSINHLAETYKTNKKAAMVCGPSNAEVRFFRSNYSNALFVSFLDLELRTSYFCDFLLFISQEGDPLFMKSK